MKKAFTLIEIVIVVAIIGVLAASGIVASVKGRDTARLKGAVRDVFATIREARSIALVSQQPCVITYSNEKKDDGTCAKISVVSAKLMDASPDLTAETIDGERIYLGDGDAPLADGDSAAAGGGETIEEILFSPVSEEVLSGIAIKVYREGSGDDEGISEVKKKSKISAFSNVDYLLGRFQESKAAEKKESSDGGEAVEARPVEEVDLETVSLVWEVNGRCEPHKVWVYPADKPKERGFMIDIDRFGAAKIVSGREEEK